MTRHARRPGSASNREDDLRVSDILSEFQSLEDHEMKHFYSTLTNNLEIQGCFFRVMSRTYDGIESREVDLETLKGICSLLLSYYRYLVNQTSRSTVVLASTASDLAKSRPIFMQYLPHLAAIHLCVNQSMGAEEKRAFKFLEAFFLAVYNTEASETQPQQTLPSNQSVRVASLSQSSIFHESGRLDAESIEKLNRRVGGGAGVMVLHEPIFRQVQSVNASTRGPILHLLWRAFNKHLPDLSKYAVEQVAHRTLKLLSCSNQRRNFVAAPILTEMLFFAYFCIYSGFQVMGNQLIDMIDERATVSGWPSVLMTTEAIKRLKIYCGPCNTSVVTSTPSQLAKHMITNASFRAKKISDDIPKVVSDDDTGLSNSTLRMKSIAEENASEDLQTDVTSPSVGVGSKQIFVGKVNSSNGEKVHVSNKEKLMAKLPNLKVSMTSKKERTHSENEASSTGGDSRDGRSDKKEKSSAEKSSKTEKKKKLNLTSAPGGSPSPTSLTSGMQFTRNGDGVSTSSKNIDISSLEQVEELIQMKRLPPETITIHSPESGTTLF